MSAASIAAAAGQQRGHIKAMMPHSDGVTFVMCVCVCLDVKSHWHHQCDGSVGKTLLFSADDDQSRKICHSPSTVLINYLYRYMCTLHSLGSRRRISDAVARFLRQSTDTGCRWWWWMGCAGTNSASWTRRCICLWLGGAALMQLSSFWNVTVRGGRVRKHA